MLKIHYILLIVFILTSFECEKKDERLLNDIENKLIGEWVWVKTVYFKSDSDKFIKENKKSDSLISKIFLPDGTYLNFNKRIKEYGGIYWVDYTKNLIDTTKVHYILFYQIDNFIDYAYFIINNDSLILDRKQQDGSLLYFRRKK